MNFEKTLNLNKYKNWEGLVVKIKDDNLPNPFVICNLYRSPRSTIPIMREFFDEITPILNCIDSPNHNIILAGDTNINLLQIHNNMLYSEFFDLVMSHSLTPQITLPTRLTRSNGTLIDNIFCKLLTPISNTHAGIHINRLSDHQPCFIFIKTQATKENPPKRVHIKHITQLGLLAAAKDMEEMNLCAKLDQSPMANVNQNYNKLYQI